MCRCKVLHLLLPKVHNCNVPLPILLLLLLLLLLVLLLLLQCAAGDAMWCRCCDVLLPKVNMCCCCCGNVLLQCAVAVALCCN
jgi:hypothetical protein